METNVKRERVGEVSGGEMESVTSYADMQVYKLIYKYIYI